MSKLLAKHQNINRETNAPKLRFNSFDESWQESTFGELSTFFPTNSLSREFLQQKAGKVKNIHYGDIHTRYRSLFDIAKEQVPFLNENVLLKIDEKSYCQAGDIIFADASEDYLDIGKCIEITNTGNQKVTAGLHTLLARPNKKIFAKGFLAQLMRSGTVRKQIMILAQGTKVLGISARHLNKLILKIPSKSEQEKIADFFTNIDEWIATLKLQQSGLEKYRKGMLQKIFSQRVRFKDESGSNFSKWEEKKIGEIFSRIKRKNIACQNVLTISAVDGLINQQKFFNKSVSSKDLSAYTLLYKGEFAYNKSYSSGYPMGAIKMLKYFDEGVVSPLYICFKVSSPSNLPEFYEHYFNSGLLNKQIAKIAQRARNHGLLNISVDDFFNQITLPCPATTEQKKITEFLTSIDLMIGNKKKQIESAEKWKKGLLQQMFV